MDVKYTMQTGGRPPVEPRATLQRSVLFPTIIWQTRLAYPGAMQAGWIAHVAALRAASPQPAGRTNRQGWNSTDMAVLDDPAFATLRQAIAQASEVALGEIANRAVDYTLQSWINIHDRGGFNYLHMHEGCLLSGCFYLQVPEGSGRLGFRDPRAGVVHSPFKGSGANTHMDVQLTPSNGLLVLFPSWLEHLVEPHEADAPRMVIAFNLLARDI